MPGYLITAQSTTVICGHGGKVELTPAVPPRVKVGGQPVVTNALPSVVQGCSLSSSGGPFCVTITAVTFATRVKVGGQPVLLIDSKGLSSETATPANVIVPQPRVKGM